jgi:hypothetical protein
MTEKKQQLSGVLNLRVDDALSGEIDRIAGVHGTSASEVARQLIRHGVEVERQVQASLLRVPYDWDTKKMPGRIVIEAKWSPYTRGELLRMDYPPEDDEIVEIEKIQ